MAMARWKKLFPEFGTVEKIGASEGIRTLDVHLGKVMLYQTELRSLPKKCGYPSAMGWVCKGDF